MEWGRLAGTTTGMAAVPSVFCIFDCTGPTPRTASMWFLCRHARVSNGEPMASPLPLLLPEAIGADSTRRGATLLTPLPVLLIQADKEDLADWEERNAADRNQGLFFQRLHKASPREQSKAGDAPGGLPPLDQEVRDYCRRWNVRACL